MESFQGSDSTWRGTIARKAGCDGHQRFSMDFNNQHKHTGINLFKKGRVDTKVFGHNVETEEVAVDAGARHGQAVHVLMLVGRPPKQGQPLVVLSTNTRWKRER